MSAVADLHQHLPKIEPCDLLLLGGDLANAHEQTDDQTLAWLDGPFRSWLCELDVELGLGPRQIIAVAGNHDFVFENGRALNLELPFTYLCDSGCEREGVSIWGSPWQPPFFDWAFNLPEGQLAGKFALIPEGTEILLTHTPPLGAGDLTASGERVGSSALTKAIKRVRPKLCVFGHIHPGYGLSHKYGARLVNASLVNGRYEPVNPVFNLEL